MNILKLAQEREEIKPGLHWVKISNIKNIFAKTTGEQMISICFQDQESKLTFFDNVTDSENNISQVKLHQLIDICGVLPKLVKDKKNPENIELHDLANYMLGCEFGVIVGMSRATTNPTTGTEYPPQPNVNVSAKKMFLTKSEYDTMLKDTTDSVI